LKLRIGLAATAVVGGLAGCAPLADEDVAATAQEITADATVATCNTTLVPALKNLLQTKDAGGAVHNGCIKLGMVYDENDFPLVGHDTPTQLTFFANTAVLVNGLKTLLAQSGNQAVIDNGGIILGLVYDENDFPVVGREHVYIKATH
jgi:hypothetical protein